MTTTVLACLQLADVLGGLTGSKLQVRRYADQVLSAFQKEPHVDEARRVHPDSVVFGQLVGDQALGLDEPPSYGSAIALDASSSSQPS